jgi:hypothetical protein
VNCDSDAPSPHRFKFDRRILNWFLIENIAFGHHLHKAADASVCVGGARRQDGDVQAFVGL